MNDLEKLTLQTIGENVAFPDVFTDDSVGMAQIRDSLNDAIEEISLLTGSTKRKFNLLCRDGVNFYRLSYSRDRFAWVTDAWLLAPKRRLEQTDLWRLGNFNPRWMKNTGNPEAYFPVGHDVLGIWPAPASDAVIVELTTVVIPSRYTTDTDRIKLQEDFQWAAVEFAVSEYYASRGDAKQALYHHQKYTEKLGIQNLYPMASDRVRRLQTNKEPWPKATA